MDPQQLGLDQTDDVMGHQHVHLDGADDQTDDVMGHQHVHLDGGDDQTDDVSGHLSGALGSKKNDDR